MKSSNPFKHFTEFLDIASFRIESTFIKPDLPCTLSTISLDGSPNSRILYLKQFDNNEFIFFTNKNSQKGNEIEQNPNVSICIFFENAKKQIRIKGKAFIAPHTFAEKYFATRPLTSKAGAIISKQSEVLEDYPAFLKSVQEYADLNKEKEMQCPEYWVAYRVVPSEFEFWEGTDFRLHLRTKYKKDLNSENLWFQYLVYP